MRVAILCAVRRFRGRCVLCLVRCHRPNARHAGCYLVWQPRSSPGHRATQHPTQGREAQFASPLAMDTKIHEEHEDPRRTRRSTKNTKIHEEYEDPKEHEDPDEHEGLPSTRRPAKTRRPIWER